MLEVRLLGQFSVRLDGQPIEIPSRPAQSLLAYLILNAGTAQRREKLSGLFWPDATDANARSNLRHALWRVRKVLSAGTGTGRDYLLTDDLTVAFEAGADSWLDVAVLTREMGDNGAANDLIGAVSVYGGELLPGFYEEWVVLERQHLQAVFERKMQRLLDSLVEAQRWPEALEWGERWIALGHVPEPAYRALMLAYGGLGDLSGVATVLRRCTEDLQRELGVEPSEQTREVYQWLSSGGAPGGLKWARAPAVSSEAAVRALLAQWRQRGVEVLDLASLALVHASPDDLALDREDAVLLIRSALHHDVDIEPWIRRAGTPAAAVRALNAALSTYPKPHVRVKIVDALERLQSADAAEILLRIAGSDDAAAVRARAAVAAARQGRLRAVTDRLLKDLNATGDAAALSALVVLADEVGLPADAGRYPRLSVALALAQRRWQARGAAIWRQTMRGALGEGLALALQGSGTPGYVALADPAGFRENLRVISAPAWVFSGALAGLVIGALQGALSAFMVGLADALWGGPAQGQSRERWRLVLGSLAGLFHSAYLIAFSLVGLLRPEAEPATYIPANVAYGLLVGLASTLAIPRLGTLPPVRRQLARSAQAAMVIALATVPYVYVVYQDQAGISLLSRLLYAVLLPFGLGLALSGREAREPEI